MSYRFKPGISRRAAGLWAAGCAVALATTAVVSTAQDAGAAAPPHPVGLPASFAAAAQETGVPLNVLEALAYQESAWDDHGGAPSTTGGYGIMQLTEISPATIDGLDPSSAKAAAVEADPTLSTARTAAKLIGSDTRTVENDDAANIHAGAALLASYAKALDGGKLPTAAGDWYSAVAKYSASADAATAKQFADRVYTTVRTGTATPALTLTGDPAVAVNTASLSALHLAAPAPVKNAKSADGTPLPECPSDLNCDYVPAALALNNPADLSSYGNYDPANRPAQSQIRYIAIHDTEGSYAGSIAEFQNPAVYASAHYIVRSSDGQVTQTVPTQDIAWDSGNWSIYQHSVSIEHEGWAIHGASWYTESEYETTADLVRYLAARYNIPLDRQHIFGHDEIPGSTDANQTAQHWDPGPYWDWSHFMDLLDAPIVPSFSADSNAAGTPKLADPAFNALGSVVVVKPDYKGNLQAVYGCTVANDPTPGAVPGQCGEQPAQATNFVWLRTAPDPTAPLLSEPYLHPDGSAGTDSADDWGDKAVTGEKFVVADREITADGVWTGIWYGGREAWFQSTWSDFSAWPSTATVVTPKPGLTSIPVYATAAPEASAYPAPIAAVDLRTPKLLTKYSIPAGQSYVTSGPAVHGEYWYARNIDGSAPDDRTEVVGTTMFYLIQYNHRFVWVDAADVNVSQH
ncbi:N-acetylmuramoyl-L-alanine amidase [Catenulispora pinisilvae]|uniref:N-acetylmuramoyl-L-alanine amidase n=1 Tax=Catenulispora pinisilvae TaxID=2705253 RepID=UPI0018923A3E|nr:N-acetylmuramoyl-L-alanine amidase [Catenulispora pinisilvae]